MRIPNLHVLFLHFHSNKVSMLSRRISLIVRRNFSRREVNGQRFHTRYVATQSLITSPGSQTYNHNNSSSYDHSNPKKKFLVWSLASCMPFLILAAAYSRDQQSLLTWCAQDDTRPTQFPGNIGTSTRELTRNFVADAVDIVAPAVVNILCAVDGYIMSGMSSGSGFIITEDGFVITNAHVVAASTDGRVIVTTKTGKRIAGRVHSLDFKSDVALVKLDDNHLDHPYPIVSLGSSANVRTGEFVIAIGSPLQLQNSASLGIVSATARHASELGIVNNRSEYIQTDAAINMGNSGGPLVNLDGEVIGISTMKARGSDGISFAIPIDTVIQVVDQLRTHGRVIRPYVGMSLANYIPDPAVSSFSSSSSSSSTSSSTDGNRGGGWSLFGGSTNKSSAQNGGRVKKKRPSKQDAFHTQEMQVIVLNVISGSPASTCGIKSGDIIMEVDGKTVNGVRDVLSVIGLEVGRMIEFKILREDKEMTMTLTTAPETTKPA